MQNSRIDFKKCIDDSRTRLTAFKYMSAVDFL